MSDFQETFSSELGDVPSEDKDSKNVLAQLRAIVAEEVNLPDVEIEVKQRPGVSVVYSPNISNVSLSLGVRSRLTVRPASLTTSSLRASWLVIRL